MTPTLPQAEIDRIRIDAQKAFPITDTSTFSGLMQDGYVAGAIHEAERGMEPMAAFAEWVDDNDFRQKSKGIWENLNGTSRTTAELLDLYLKENEK